MCPKIAARDANESETKRTIQLVCFYDVSWSKR
jgi:hypothetical protein